MRTDLSGAALEKSWRAVHLVWLSGMGFGVVVWIGLPLVLQPPSPRDVGPLRVVVLFVVSLADLGLGWWFKTRALDPRSYGTLVSFEDAAGRIAGQSLIVVTLPFTPAVFAIVAYLLTGSLAAMSGLCALSLLGLLLLRPRLEEWRDTLRGVSVDAHRAP